MWWLPLVAAGASIVGNVMGANAQADAMRRANQLTPEQRAYGSYLKQKAATGVYTQEDQQRMMSPVLQAGQQARQRVTGAIIKQGLEGSIVAAELRRRTDADTQRAIAQQARTIAAENRKSKEAYREQSLQYEAGIAAQRQQVNAQAAALTNPMALIGQNLGTLVGGITGAYGDYRAGQELTPLEGYEGMYRRGNDPEGVWVIEDGVWKRL